MLLRLARPLALSLALAGIADTQAANLPAVNTAIATTLFTSNGTYTPSAGARTTRVIACGGGGGGGGRRARCVRNVGLRRRWRRML